MGEDTSNHPLLRAADRLARDLLEPHAAEVDRGTVPRSHLDAIGAAGLLGIAAPERVGGSAAPGPVVRAVTEALAGADLATWFVQVQHHSPVRALAESGGFDELLADLAAGRLLAGLAIAHLRRRPHRAVTATRVRAGWRLDGVAPWYTGWGLNDRAYLGAVTEAGEVVFALVDAGPAAGLVASEPIRVAAVQAAVTVTLTLDGYQLPDSQVVSVQDWQLWLDRDGPMAANANAAVFGVAGSALRLLRGHGEQRAEPAAVAAADRIGEQLARARSECYRLIDEVPAAEQVPQRLAARAAAHRVMTEATNALVIAGAGGSMALTSAAQRKAREAMFLLVQAQTRDARTAALDACGRNG